MFSYTDLKALTVDRGHYASGGGELFSCLLRDTTAQAYFVRFRTSMWKLRTTEHVRVRNPSLGSYITSQGS